MQQKKMQENEVSHLQNNQHQQQESENENQKSMNISQHGNNNLGLNGNISMNNVNHHMNPIQLSQSQCLNYNQLLGLMNANHPQFNYHQSNMQNVIANDQIDCILKNEYQQYLDPNTINELQPIINDKDPIQYTNYLDYNHINDLNNIKNNDINNYIPYRNINIPIEAQYIPQFTSEFIYDPQTLINPFHFNFGSIINNQNNKNYDSKINFKKIFKEDKNSQYKENSKRQYIRKNPEKVKRWTREESILYEQFVEINYDTMKNSALKRNTKIFMLMSRFIGTKTPSQCRSHHQKFYKNLISKMEMKKLSAISQIQKYGSVIQQMKNQNHLEDQQEKKQLSDSQNNNQFIKRINQKRKIAEKKLILNQSQIIKQRGYIQDEKQDFVKNEEIFNQWINMQNFHDFNHILNQFHINGQFGYQAMQQTQQQIQQQLQQSIPKQESIQQYYNNVPQINYPNDQYDTPDNLNLLSNDDKNKLINKQNIINPNQQSAFKRLQ